MILQLGVKITSDEAFRLPHAIMFFKTQKGSKMSFLTKFWRGIHTHEKIIQNLLRLPRNFN